MRYSDIARFEAPLGLARRFGYKKMLVVGKDLLLVQKPQEKDIPQVIISRDPGTLINGVKDINVIGIVFDGDELVKRVLEKAVEYKKIIFVPVGEMLVCDIRERGPRLGKLRKIVFAAHKIGAKIRLVTLASSDIELLSARQLDQVGRFLLKGNDNVVLFGDIL